MNTISLAQPVFRGREREYVLECLESTRISSTGRFVDIFERDLSAFCNTTDAITCSNGTAALHLALKSLGVGPGDEVIVPALTYVATANAVVCCGGRPVFADVEADTGTICPQEIKKAITSRTRGVIAVHLYGHPADMDPITHIAREHNLFVLEDAAEAIGAQYKGKPVGSLGIAGTFSFYGNKIITCGEGGAVVTSNTELAATIRLFRGQGVDPNRTYWHPVIGFNYRMSNLLAAVALAQLEEIEWHQKRRKELFLLYDKLLNRVQDHVDLPKSRANCLPAQWLYTVRLRSGSAAERNRLADLLSADGIETRPVFYPVCALPPYAENQQVFPQSEAWASRGLCLPTHSALTEDEVEYIVSRLTLHLTCAMPEGTALTRVGSRDGIAT